MRSFYCYWPDRGKLYPTRSYRPGTTAGVPDQLVLRLNPPPIPRLVTEVAGWGALGAFLAGGVSYAGAWLQHDAYRSEIIGSRRDPIDGDAAAQGQALGRDLSGRVSVSSSAVRPSRLSTGSLAPLRTGRAMETIARFISTSVVMRRGRDEPQNLVWRSSGWMLLSGCFDWTIRLVHD